MFPTPPSIEHHPNCSPYEPLTSDAVIPELLEGPKMKLEVYPNLGSPTPEPIDVSEFK